MPLAPTQLQAAKEVQGFNHCSSTEKIQTRTATGMCERARRDLQALLFANAVSVSRTHEEIYSSHAGPSAQGEAQLGWE